MHFSAPYNWDEKGQQLIYPSSMRSWITGRSMPSPQNYGRFKEALSNLIDAQRAQGRFPWSMPALFEDMRRIMPGEAAEIDRMARGYDDAVKAANGAMTEEVARAARDAVLGVLALAYGAGKAKPQAEPKGEGPRTAQLHPEVTIFSPVSVQVFLSDRSQPLMYIDRNRGHNYQRNPVPAREAFKLIFEAKGFCKEVVFHADGASVRFDLGALLTREEIVRSYDADEARRYLERNEPTGYTFESLGAAGTREDIRSIATWLRQWKAEAVEDGSINYLIARACVAMADLMVRFRDGSNAGLLDEIGAAYRANASYGHLLEGAQKKVHSCFQA